MLYPSFTRRQTITLIIIICRKFIDDGRWIRYPARPTKLFHSPLTLSCGSSISSNHILLFESHFGSKLAMTGTISHPNFCLIVSPISSLDSSQTLCLCRTTRQNSALWRLSRLCECPQSRRCLKSKIQRQKRRFRF